MSPVLMVAGAAFVLGLVLLANGQPGPGACSLATAFTLAAGWAWDAIKRPWDDLNQLPDDGGDERSMR